MHHNVGIVDMCVRLMVGVILLYIGVTDNPIIPAGLLKIIIAIFGIIVTLSALIRNCPLYYLAGINTTCNKKE